MKESNPQSPVKVNGLQIEKEENISVEKLQITNNKKHAIDTKLQMQVKPDSDGSLWGSEAYQELIW